ncbi:MAG: hypothetical protein K6F17_03010 [Lachnospiraceae bacterium]|nr:hypothetical protein [Lachnospiraceae bacterium]
MSYLYSKKNWIAAIMAVWGYVVYFAFDKIDGKIEGYNQGLLMYISKPAFIYMAVLTLVTVYITLEFRSSGCFELCFDVYGRRNCGYVFGLLGLNSFLSLLTLIIVQVLSYKKFGFDKLFFGLISQRVILSYLLGGTFCILAGFSISYIFNIKGAIVATLILLIIASPKIYEIMCTQSTKYGTMIFMQNFDIVQGRDGMLSPLDMGNMKPYKWIKIIGMIALGLITIVKLTVKRSRYFIVALLGLFIGCEVYYYRVHDRSLEEFMNINQDVYYQALQQSGEYYNQYYDFESPFVIESYDLDMKFGDYMDVRCEMKLAASDAGLDEYMFTLYHTLKVKSVTYDGKKIDYKRDGDCITVGRLGTGVIAIEYSGFVDRNIANSSAILLCEAIPYYPVAGKRMVGSYTITMNDFKSVYKVKVNVPGVYTNLDKVSEKSFEGMSYGPCIVKGLLSEMDIDGMMVLVPKYAEFKIPDKKQIEDYLKFYVDQENVKDIKFIGIGLEGYYNYVYDMPFNDYLVLPMPTSLGINKEMEYADNN